MNQKEELRIHGLKNLPIFNFPSWNNLKKIKAGKSEKINVGHGCGSIYMVIRLPAFLVFTVQYVIQGIPAFREFTVRDPRYFVIPF